MVSLELPAGAISSGGAPVPGTPGLPQRRTRRGRLLQPRHALPRRRQCLEHASRFVLLRHGSKRERSSVTAPADLLAETERRLCSMASPEPILARGIAHELEREGSARPQRVRARVYLVVTPSKMIWSSSADPIHYAILEFRDVSEVTGVAEHHRYILNLRHRPTPRRRRSPRWRFLWWSWGQTMLAEDATESALMFSRKNTRAALAIVERFAELGVPVASKVREMAPRSERIRGSQAQLKRTHRP